VVERREVRQAEPVERAELRVGAALPDGDRTANAQKLLENRHDDLLFREPRS
jgi:hypothetical protein